MSIGIGEAAVFGIMVGIFIGLMIVSAKYGKRLRDYLGGAKPSADDPVDALRQQQMQDDIARLRQIEEFKRWGGGK